ncbi:MAG: hypothetical protein ACSHX0_06875 [Akkermansiaceae bacterium]
MRLKADLVNEKLITRELEKLAKLAGIEGDKYADFAAEVAAKGLVRETQPFGVGAKARRSGEGAIYKDLGAAFQVVPSNARGGDVISSISAAKSHHASVRGSSGRVSRSARKRKISIHIYKQYQKIVLARVGSAKGSWAGVAQKLGVRPQKWILRSKGSGDFKRAGRRGKRSWTMSAMPKHVAEKRVLGASGAARVLKKQEKMIMMSLKGKLRRKFAKKV